MKRINLQNQLSYRLTKSTILVALLLGTILNLIQISLDFSREKKNVDIHVKQLLNTIKYPSSQAAYTLDSVLSNRIIEGLFEDKSVAYASIKDDLDKSLGSNSKLLVEKNYSWLLDPFLVRVKRYTQKLFIEEPNEKLFVGKIIVDIDTYIILEGFFDRAFSTLVSGIIKNLILAFILVFLFKKFLTKPLFLLAKQLKKVDYSKKLTEEFFNNYKYKNDEIDYIAQTIQKAVNSSVDSKKSKEDAEKRKEESLKDLLENISHQWRQPLTVINLATSNIEDSVDFGEKVDKKDIKNIYEETKYLSDTLNFFNSVYSRSDAIETINIKNFLEKLIVNLRMKTKQKIEFSIFIEDLEVSSNEFILHEVFINILNNTLEVAKERRIEAVKLEFSGKRLDEKHIEIEVTDNAGGIKEDVLETIFEPYTTTHHKERSKGLGLYKVKNLIESHLGGKIHIYNLNDGVAVNILIKEL